MEKLDPKINTWLKKHLIPRLAVTFREKYNLIEDVKCNVTRPKGSFYLSDLFFVTIQFPGNNSSREKCLLVKLPPQDNNVQKHQNYNAMFSNEIIFYQTIAEGSSEYPTCYLCGDDPVFGKIIVLENLSPRGYFICPSKTNLPFDYLSSGLQTLGRFHGHTYTLKELNPMKFHEIVNNITNTRYTQVNELTNLFERNINTSTSRVTRNLQSRSTCDSIFMAKVTRLFENCYSSVMKRSVKSREPLTTIVHSDCTVNNILFRERRMGGENGEIILYEGILVDFVLIMYSSSATDVSTFLYVNGSRYDIKEHFQELFKVYHDALAEYLKEHKIWDPVKYSYDALLQDYKLSGLFGYVIATFFFPIMTEYEKDNDLLDQPEKLLEQLHLTGGGEVLTEQLVDTLFDAHEAGLTDYYINKQTD